MLYDIEQKSYLGYQKELKAPGEHYSSNLSEIMEMAVLYMLLAVTTWKESMV